MSREHEGMDLALLVEFSEARAYRSLLQAAPRQYLDSHGLRAVNIGSAVAVSAASVTNTLNMNRVIGLGVAETAAESMVDEIVDMYARCDISFGIEVGPFARPAELTRWLHDRRIRRGIATAVHYRRPTPLSIPESPLRVRRARSDEHELVADICCSVFRMPPVARALIAGTGNAAEWRLWLAHLDDRPVAAALSFVKDDVAWLGWDATLSESRGRGAQRALIAHRVNDACAAGCRYVTTETAVNTGDYTDPSFRNYQRAGFSLAYERSTYIGLRGAGRRRRQS
jgi:Acetyltransferase (GNAT) domain